MYVQWKNLLNVPKKLPPPPLPANVIHAQPSHASLFYPQSAPIGVIVYLQPIPVGVVVLPEIPTNLRIVGEKTKTKKQRQK